MPAAELIAIGTEFLLGEIQDTNTRYLARNLRDLGVDIFRATLIGDNTERIAQVIREAMQRCQIIITTGGLGPTVDDPTRAAVALALDVDVEFRPELWEQIQARFSALRTRSIREQPPPGLDSRWRDPRGKPGWHRPRLYLRNGQRLYYQPARRAA